MFERDGHVVDDGVLLRQRHVVHHRPVVDGHVDGAAHATIGAHDDVLHVVQPLRQCVDDGVHLAGVGVDLRVRGEGAGQRAEEVVAGDGLQLVGQLDRAAAGLDHRPGGAGEPADVGVRAAGTVVPVAARDVGLATAVR